MDYYKKVDYDMKAESAEDRNHANHCVENLQQRLMCSPDRNIYTYHWVNKHEMPWGNLRSNLFSSHRCVDWDHFYTWVLDNMLHCPAPVAKPEGAEVWY